MLISGNPGQLRRFEHWYIVMYTNHYNLKENPFREVFDPRFCWLGKKYRDALSEFKYYPVIALGLSYKF